MLIAIIEGDIVGQIADHTEIFPRTSFPKSGPSLDFLKENSCLPVRRHEYDYNTHVAVPADPYIEDDAVYRERVVSLTEEQLNEKERMRIAGAEMRARANRDRLLQSSDWTQLADVSLQNAEEWKIYRQELRDISSQEGFPFNINWPTQPE